MTPLTPGLVLLWPTQSSGYKTRDTNPFQVLRQPSRHTQTQIRTHVHTVLHSGRSQYGSGTVGMQVAAGIQGRKGGRRRTHTTML